MEAMMPPLPAWFVGNQTLMRYLQLIPMTMMYFIPPVLLLSLTYLVFEEMVFARDKFPVHGKTVVITGGSQGLGRALGKLFAQKGANVVLVSRDKAKLKKATEYISASAKDPRKQKFALISADLTDPNENVRVIREVIAWNNDKVPDIVWANAGFSMPSLFLDASIENLRQQFDSNYWTATYLAQATLRAWLVPKEGSMNDIIAFEDGTARRTKPEARHFIMTSSSAAFCGLAGYTAYAPAKAALRSLHDNLHSELQLYNGANASKLVPDIRIHTLFPGGISTPGLIVENALKHPVTVQLEESDPVQTAEEVARIAFAELEKGRSLITTQYLAAAMRASSLQGSMRDRPLVDTVFSWVTSVLWLFIAPEMESRVFKWGKKKGLPNHAHQD